MFAKFVTHVEGEGILSSKAFGVVVPKHNTVYEAEEITYGKKCFHCFADYIKWIEASKDTPAMTIGSFPESKDELFEVVVVCLYKKGEVEFIHAPGCEFYLLNNEGKTIDRLWCAELPKQRELLKQTEEGRPTEAGS